jgi:hypothetical protein
MRSDLKVKDTYKNVIFDRIEESCCVSWVFEPNHMPSSEMDLIHISLKPEEYFVTAMRSYLREDGEKHGYKDKIEELIKAGKMKLVSMRDFTRRYKDGIEMLAEQPRFFVVL